MRILTTVRTMLIERMWVLVPALNPPACHRNRAFIPFHSNSLFITIILMMMMMMNFQNWMMVKSVQFNENVFGVFFLAMRLKDMLAHQKNNFPSLWEDFQAHLSMLVASSWRLLVLLQIPSRDQSTAQLGLQTVQHCTLDKYLYSWALGCRDNYKTLNISRYLTLDKSSVTS